MDTLRGMLQIEVPHWAAQLKVCDSRGKVILRADQMLVQALTSEGQKPVYQVTAGLEPGVYEVELSLEGKTARQFAIVRDTGICELTRSSWEPFGLTLKSVVPRTNKLFLTDNPQQEAQSRAAQAWSSKSTGSKSTGNSQLFLFVRTTGPQKDNSFFDKLSLLDHNEKLITDFSDGVKSNKNEGWMAFCAKLPAGYYLLKRQRYDQYRTKYQPLYLCENWVTQAFMLAPKRPSLQTLTLGMAPIGTDFRPEDELVEAADILLNSLRRGTNPDRLITLDTVTRLFSDRAHNPWLTILSAYIIRLQQDQLANDPSSAVWPKLLDSWPMLESRLTLIRDHPDVQALLLDMNEPVAAPILYPPLLFSGLRRVQQHALHFTNTIPITSLLKRVLPRVSTTSVWTAWRQTSQPAHAPTPKKSVDLESDVLADAPESMSIASQSVNSSSPDYLRFVNPKLPVYQVQSSFPEARASSNQTGGQQEHQAVARTLLNVLALQATQSLVDTRLEDIPNTTQLNQKTDITQLLANDQADAISQASGIPLVQVQSSLTKLQATCQQPTKTAKNLSTYDRTVFGYAVQRATELPSNDPFVATIEDCVNKLLTESGRLLATNSVDIPTSTISTLAERINQLADQLLLSARFIVLTDAGGKILLTNGAFILLLKKEFRLTDAHIGEWESLFKTAPFGTSILPYSYVNKGSLAWELQRSVLHDDDHNQVVYLNMFQNKDSVILTEVQLKQVGELLPTLVLFTSSIAYDKSTESIYSSGEQQPVQKLESVLTRMAQILAKAE